MRVVMRISRLASSTVLWGGVNMMAVVGPKGVIGQVIVGHCRSMSIFKLVRQLIINLCAQFHSTTER